MNQTKKIIGKYVKNISELIIKTNMNYEIWWELSGTNIPKYVSLLNQEKHFWISTINAHYSNLIICLYKLFDKNNDTVNLMKLQKVVKKNKIFKDKEFNALISEYKKASFIWEKVKILRHNLYAHNSLKFVDYKDVYKKANVTPDEFKELIELSIKIIDIIYGKSHNSSILFCISAIEDTHSVLKKLSR